MQNEREDLLEEDLKIVLDKQCSTKLRDFWMEFGVSCVRKQHVGCLCHLVNHRSCKCCWFFFFQNITDMSDLFSLA